MKLILIITLMMTTGHQILVEDVVEEEAMVEIIAAEDAVADVVVVEEAVEEEAPTPKKEVAIIIKKTKRLKSSVFEILIK